MPPRHLGLRSFRSRRDKAIDPDFPPTEIAREPLGPANPSAPNMEMRASQTAATPTMPGMESGQKAIPGVSGGGAGGAGGGKAIPGVSGGGAGGGGVVEGLDGVNPLLAGIASQIVQQSGGSIWITSGWRSVQRQQELRDDYLAGRGPLAAPAGQSNHNHGMAVDFGGDKQLLAQLAEQHGLEATVAGEDWHYELGPELMGQVDDGWYQNAGLNMDLDGSQPPEQVLHNRLNWVSGVLGFDPMVNIQPHQMDMGAQTDLDIGDPTQFNYPDTWSGGTGEIDAFMRGLMDMESGGNYSAIGPMNPGGRGRATGAYQFLDGTWGGYGGYQRAVDAPPHVQDQRARELISQYYEQFGSWEAVAAAWHAGPASAAVDAVLAGQTAPGGDVNMGTAEYIQNVMGGMSGYLGGQPISSTHGTWEGGGGMGGGAGGGAGGGGGSGGSGSGSGSGSGWNPLDRAASVGSSNRTPPRPKPQAVTPQNRKAAYAKKRGIKGKAR